MARVTKPRTAKPKMTKPDPAPPLWATSQVCTAPWMADNASYLAGRSMVDEIDDLVVKLERRWGCGRLRLLVSVDLRERFDRQRLLWNRTFAEGTLEQIRLQAQRTRNAWMAIERAALDGGHTPLPPEVWETATPDGRVFQIVREISSPTGDEKCDRHVIRYSLDEVMRLLLAYPQVAKAKAIFPGATVERAEQVRDPLESVVAFDDSIPF